MGSGSGGKKDTPALVKSRGGIITQQRPDRSLLFNGMSSGNLAVRRGSFILYYPMILTGNEIINQVRLGNIVIDPFDEKNVNPNSYNYRLGDKYTLVPKVPELRCLRAEDLREIPEEGLLLSPRQLYLAATHEVIGSNRYVVCLIGRSSVGRLGLFLQVSADLGNLGPSHRWTLELTCVQPIVVYPMMKIGQVSFWVPEGDIVEYNGSYTNFNVPRHCDHRLLF